MKNTYFLSNIIGLILLSCGNDTTNTEASLTENKILKQTITAKTIEGFDYIDYTLSNEAKTVVSTWEKYQELAIQIKYLKKADLSFFNSDVKLLKAFIEAFKTETPDQLNTRPIRSRIAVMETTLLKLYDDLTLSNIKTTVKLSSIKEVLITFSNLNYRINKKIEFDLYKKIEP